jgi:NADH-quinone oxidoreductase subunit N
MSGTDLLALLPLEVMGGTVLVVLLAFAAFRRAEAAMPLALVGSLLSLAALWPARAVAPRQVTPLLVIDGYALFFMGLILVATIAVLLLSHGYLARRGEPPQDFHLLLLMAAFGAMAMVASSHFALFFLGLETLSISLLGLIAYPQGSDKPLEASIKYLILAGASSAFLLFGIALIYLQIGSLAFPEIAARLRQGVPAGQDVLWLAGLALLFTGFGFKLSLVPFHMWAPDVYQGAPAPVAGFIATVSKGAVFALLLRYFLTIGTASAGAATMVEAVAVASMLAGNLLALLQNNVKRLLAYSSIAHLGYLLLALLTGGPVAVEAMAYYLVAYFVMTLGAFGVITVLSATDEAEDVDGLAAYRGLMWRRPWLGGSFALMLLSLAGLPLTMGFFAKIYILTAGVSGKWWPAVGALVVGSVIGLFYYLRVIAVMIQPAVEPRPPAASPPWPGAATLAVLTVALVWLGVQPTPLVRLIRIAAAQVLGGAGG